MDRAIEATIRELADRTEVIDTITRLCVGTDNRDWSLVERCFAATVRFDMSSMGGAPATEMAATAIIAAWEAGLRPLAAVHHQAGNHLVRLNGDRADASCYAVATHYRPAGAGGTTRTFVGSYDFGLAREGDRWVITAFTFTLKYIDGNLNLETS